MRSPDKEYFFGQASRRLYFQEWGSPDHPPVLLVHGFPGCAEHGMLLSSTPYMSQMRLISFDRPGYGRSDFQKVMSPLILASQIRDFLDEKRINEIRILSVSGGAPFAMAMAHLLGERVKKMSSVAGVAPLTIQNFRFMNSQQKKAWLLRWFVPRPLLKLALEKIWISNLEKLDEMLFTNVNQFSSPDQVVIKHPIIGPALANSLKTALAQGPNAILSDIRVYADRWGFPLSEVRCPVTLWHGSEDDIVHFRFAKDMETILPFAQLKLINGEGHYSLPMSCRDEIIADLFINDRPEV